MPNSKDDARVRAIDGWLAATPATEETLADAASDAALPDYRRDPGFVAGLLRGQLGQSCRSRLARRAAVAKGPQR